MFVRYCFGVVRELRRSLAGKHLLMVLAFFVALKATVYAAWTPLIQSSDFTGILADIGATASGIISILIVILGIGILVRVLSR